MNFIDVNNLVDLPRVVEQKLRLNGFLFKRVAPYGWFAHRHDNSEVKHLFDFFSIEEVPELLRKLDGVWSDCTTVRIPYTDELA